MASFLAAALPYLAQLGGSAGGLSGFGGLANALGGGGLGTMAGSTMAGGMQGPTQGSGIMGALSGGNMGTFNSGTPWNNPDEKKATPQGSFAMPMQSNRFVNGLNRV